MNIKNTLMISTVLLGLLFMPTNALADNTTCVTQYGGAVVCGAETPKTPTVVHTPKNTALGDVNSALVAGSLFALGAFTFLKSRNISPR